MSVVAVIMAGGAGLRMGRPKPLVPVMGAPLLERAVGEVARAAFAEQVWVVTPAHTPQIGAWFGARAAALSQGLGLRLTHHVEQTPRGNVGALSELPLGDADAVVLFADNMTQVPLATLVQAHRERGAALTLATRTWRAQCPYGVLDVVDGRVRGYEEKPWVERTISSGVYVVSALARAGLPFEGLVGASDLTRATLAAGGVVVAHEHGGAWVDVNTPEEVAAAAAILRANPELERLPFAAAPRQVDVHAQREVTLDHVGMDGACWRLHLRPDGGALPDSLRADDMAVARIAAWEGV